LAPAAGRWMALAVILLGYWGAFAVYPQPGPDFHAPRVDAAWSQVHDYQGFVAHWNKNSNLAWAFDVWFLNCFSQRPTFDANPGGYATLSFIPTLGTMILGLIAGGWLRSLPRPAAKVGLLMLAGVVCLGLGWTADVTGVCPIVKRIWTPAWTLFS